MSNKLVIAAAGSGKTSFLVKEALSLVDENVLITTFTETNEAEIRNKIIEKNKFIPSHVTIQTWFSFLLQHGVKPYQGYLFRHDIKGMHLVNGQSAPYIKESDILNHYFDKQQKIYSDKISKFIIKCNKACGGKVIDRLSRIHTHIFIDEVQDLSGYDLDFLKLLFASSVKTLLVGDPRQGTYSTSNSAKNKKFKKSEILGFFEDKTINIEKDETSLTVNYRSITAICEIANKLYPQHPSAESGNASTTNHDGLYMVRPEDVDIYLDEYAPMQLRDSKRTRIENGYPVMNFGQSKGLSFDRVLVYPTEPIIAWLKNSAADLAQTSRSKLYVAITRGRFSVAFVYKFKNDEVIAGIENFLPGNRCRVNMGPSITSDAEPIGPRRRL